MVKVQIKSKCGLAVQGETENGGHSANTHSQIHRILQCIYIYIYSKTDNTTLQNVNR